MFILGRRDQPVIFAVWDKTGNIVGTFTAYLHYVESLISALHTSFQTGHGRMGAHFTIDWGLRIIPGEKYIFRGSVDGRESYIFQDVECINIQRGMAWYDNSGDCVEVTIDTVNVVSPGSCYHTMHELLMRMIHPQMEYAQYLGMTSMSDTSRWHGR